LGAVQLFVGHKHALVGRLSLTVPNIAAKPGGLVSPIDVLVRLKRILASTAEAKGLKAHRLQRDIASENDQVGPRNFIAVFLLDRPQQPARLVETDVVGPAIERRESLLT